ncbi:MAG TPA: nuclear transport factor 2 family protein [Pyrinomonadaceae bacterium]|jgi:hypothetical protein
MNGARRSERRVAVRCIRRRRRSKNGRAANTRPTKRGADERSRAFDIDGNAAILKVSFDEPGTRFSGYVSMLKLCVEWKIVN